MNRSNGLHIAIRPEPAGVPLHDLAAGVPVMLVLSAGMALTLCGWFPSLGLDWWMLFPALAALSLGLSLLRLTGRGRTGLRVIPVLLAAACAMAHRKVMGGLACLGNDLLDRVTGLTGRICLDFAVARDVSPLWGLAPLAILWAVLLELTLQTGKVRFILPALLCVCGGVLTGLYPVDGGVALIGLGTVLLVMGIPKGLPTWLAVPALCLLVAAGLCWNADSPGHTAQWRQSFHAARYDSGTNSMPEGDLTNLPGWNKSDAPALEVTMTQPQKLYLRGAVYEAYDGSAWTALDNGTRAAYEDLFYWLHQSAFFGQSQIGTAAALTEEAETAVLTVKNLSACASRGYYPYALAGSEALDGSAIGDDGFPQTGTVNYYPGSVPEWYAIQHALASNQDSFADYLAAEAGYRAYVTETDLQLTNESWSVLDRQLGREDGPQTLSQIRSFIRAWLDENLKYDEKAQTRSGGADFLQYTLEGSGSGYSVHYATAATLMLRYFGVPARYVEGYFLSAEEAAGYEAGETVILTEAHAHAWAEYYLPGVGFVPFEVTPGYVDDEELGGEDAESQQTYTGDHLKYAQVEQPEQLKEPEQPRFSFRFKPVWLLYAALVLLSWLAGAVILKRKRFRQALDAMDRAANRESVTLRFGYAAALLNTCGGLTVPGAEGAEELNREALFSDHDMTDSQRTEMDNYARRVLEACKQIWTIPQKLRYWLWDCLY